MVYIDFYILGNQMDVSFFPILFRKRPEEADKLKEFCHRKLEVEFLRTTQEESHQDQLICVYQDNKERIQNPNLFIV